MFEVARDDATFILKNKNNKEFAYILNYCEKQIDTNEEMTSLV